MLAEILSENVLTNLLALQMANTEPENNNSPQKTTSNIVTVTSELLEDKCIESSEKNESELYYTFKIKEPPMIKKHESKKAYIILGIDPSLEKLKEKLGSVEGEFEVIEGIPITENPSSKCPFILNKKETKKACKVLGYDPSQVKAFEILGIENKELLVVEEQIADTITTLI